MPPPAMRCLPLPPSAFEEALLIVHKEVQEDLPLFLYYYFALAVSSILLHHLTQDTRGSAEGATTIY